MCDVCHVKDTIFSQIFLQLYVLVRTFVLEEAECTFAAQQLHVALCTHELAAAKWRQEADQLEAGGMDVIARSIHFIS